MSKILKIFILFHFVPQFTTGQAVQDSLFLVDEATLYFESGAYELESKNERKLDTLINTFKNVPSSFIFIQAHTDDVGSVPFNERLSQKRSEAVKTYLLGQGIADTTIKSSFHGEKLRIRLGIDSKSRSLNRRATVQVLKNRPMIQLSGQLIDEEDKVPIQGKVMLSGRNFDNETDTDTDGNYKILAPLDEYIEISAIAKDYFLKSQRIKTSRVHEKALIKLSLPKAKIGRVFRFENINFVGGRSLLLKRSKPALALLTKYMLLDTMTCIEIAGHINLPFQPKTPLDSGNHYLSIARAVKIQRKLVEARVNPDRILSRGYGNWKMLYPKAKSQEHQSLNRRVEIIISACDSTRLIADHLVPDGYDFDLITPANELSIYKKFDEATFKVDAIEWPDEVRRKIASQIRRMKEAKREISSYTYQELLAAYPNLPE